MASNMELRSILFMKVGPHSGLSLEEIIAIKEEEERKYGRFFWGYAGTLCHPFKVVDFARQIASNGDSPKMVMSYTPSKYSGSLNRLREFSLDGVRWRRLPNGVVLTGCKYAVVGKNLRQWRSKLDLNSYIIWNGGNASLWTDHERTLGDYLKGQVNKACAVLSPSTNRPLQQVEIVYVADIIEPYCVFVK